MKQWLILFGLLTLTFKDVVKYDHWRLVHITLKQLKRVESLVMTKAQRGQIVYEGQYIGDAESLVDSLLQTVGEQLKVEWKQTGEKVEMIITPLHPS